MGSRERKEEFIQALFTTLEVDTFLTMASIDQIKIAFICLNHERRTQLLARLRASYKAQNGCEELSLYLLSLQKLDLLLTLKGELGQHRVKDVTPSIFRPPDIERKIKKSLAGLEGDWQKPISSEQVDNAWKSTKAILNTRPEHAIYTQYLAQFEAFEQVGSFIGKKLR